MPSLHYTLLFSRVWNKKMFKAFMANLDGVRKDPVPLDNPNASITFNVKESA